MPSKPNRFYKLGDKEPVEYAPLDVRRARKFVTLDDVWEALTLDSFGINRMICFDGEVSRRLLGDLCVECGSREGLAVVVNRACGSGSNRYHYYTATCRECIMKRGITDVG